MKEEDRGSITLWWLCKILPPRGLYIPVLPVKMNMCRTCSENHQQTRRQHSDKERTLTGTCVTDELTKALEKGYVVQRIYEVWYFDETEQYDPKTKTEGLFIDYVNTFLKQEASGWPEWCQSENDKWGYIRDYHEKEGILLGYNNIKKNPGLRALAKLMLNSFWRKFGQRSNMPQIKYISEPAEYFDMLTSDQILVMDINFVSDDMVEMIYQYKRRVHRRIRENQRSHISLYHSSSAFEVVRLLGSIRTPCHIRRYRLTRVCL